MHVGRHTTAQSAEIHSLGVHLSTWLTVGKERARIFFPRYGVAHGRAQEPTPGSAVKFRGKSVRKNRPLVPRSNIAGSWTRGGGGNHAGRMHHQDSDSAYPHYVLSVRYHTICGTIVASDSSEPRPQEYPGVPSGEQRCQLTKA